MRLLHNSPALLIGKTLVIADVHTNMEDKLNWRGIMLSDVTGRMLGKILALASETGAKKLVIIGDAKDEIIGISERTMNFYSELSSKMPVLILKGNHDGSMERLGSESLKVNDEEILGEKEGGKTVRYGLCHGHSWPSEKLMRCDFLIIAHQHAQIEISGKRRKSRLRETAYQHKHVEQAWLVAGLDKEKAKGRYPHANPRIRLVIMPSFNELAGGFPVGRGTRKEALGTVPPTRQSRARTPRQARCSATRRKRVLRTRCVMPALRGHQRVMFASRTSTISEHSLGPLLKNNLFKLERAIAYRIDGTCLGELSRL